MTLRVEPNPEMEARLVAEARSQDVPLEKLAERLLKEALTASSLPHGVLSEQP
jgi:predicted HicB family RNase H-like nuclease